MTALDVAPTVGLRGQVLAALGEVIDPELDEAITDLGFVRSVEVRGSEVGIHLRLPTSFCSPNFAFLMASDARDAVAALAEVDAVSVELDDHHDSEVINRGLAAGADFTGTYGAEAEEELDVLRTTFRRKAHLAATERALSALLARRGDIDDAELRAVTLADLPDGPDRQRILRRRRDLGLPTTADAPVLLDDDGAPVAPGTAAAHLRRARSVRISLDGNAHFCRGLLRTRYPESAADQAPRPSDVSVVPVPVPLSPTRRSQR